MVQRVFGIVYREVRGLHQAAYVLAVFTFLSQLLALMRDRLLAHQFGAGVELDLYYTAFRIPDVLYVLFASALSVYVLIPFIARKTGGEKSGAHAHILSQVFTVFLVAYSVVALLGMIFAPALVTYLFPGFAHEQETLVLLVRILLLQPLFLGISSIYGVVTQMEHRFVLYAISPLMYNLGIILGLLVLYPYFGMSGLAWGVVLGAFGHVCVQLPYVLKSPLLPRVTRRLSLVDILEVLQASLIRAGTLSLHQLVLLGLVGIASIMAVGSVSVFQFAFNLQSVPLAIIGVSYSVAAFPLLAELYAEGKRRLFGENVMNALRHIMFWSLPAIALFVVIRAQFVRVVLGSGEFDWSDTRLTAAILAILIVSLMAQATHLLLVRALYAVGNTKLPFFVTLASSVCALGLALFFYILLLTHPAISDSLTYFMRLEGVPGIEVLALPLGYSCALILHSIALITLGRRELHISLRALIRPALVSLLASAFGGYVAYATLNYFTVGYETDTLLAIFIQGATAGGAGLAGVMLVHTLLKTRELHEILEAVRRKFGKTNVVIPQDEDTLSV